jgi:hypothetical protein
VGDLPGRYLRKLPPDPDGTRWLALWILLCAAGFVWTVLEIVAQ